MRSIRELLTTEEKVWVYIGNEELWADFLRSAEGFTFGELPRDKWKFGHVIGVHSDGTMGHVSLFLWSCSFSENAENYPKKIDFSKFINGGSDYLCERSHFSGRLMFSAQK
ncbi:hypothetical protein [Ruminococcus flavefaciens]|uniref:hypothetical protein n=1 Tax=Ruminococcus flavefaciens TaxID=1265 RepID=UPI0026F33A69|nr:hypothetical protein [Ruminococcus flavefaciens]MDD7515473.1 hypothetical protein [Ruminococcus flavefaciens]MDY5692670.1 hypothetical protein [Ruminococcus flavefaciens]